jgi:glucose/arabinose dehydrogenase
MSVRALLASIILFILVGAAQAPARPTPPATPVISSGPATSTTATSATFVFSSSTDGSAYLCSLDSARFVACTSPQNYSGLTAGNHVFQVEAKLKGQVSPPASWAWTIQAPPPGQFVETPYASGLSTPTAMAFAPDGTLFVAEKTGALRVISGGTLLATPFLTVSVDTGGEQGLLGVAIDPNFATNRFVYVYYSSLATGQNRLSRFTASASNPNVAAAGSEFVLLDNVTGTATNHQGGAIHFASDGKLYLAVGDDANSTDADELDTLRGKILRLNADGSIPGDNPFVGVAGARTETWAYGLRNPFSFAVDPGSSRIYVNDVGEATWEEVNALARGANYGWPTCEGPMNTGVGTCTSTAFTYPIHAYTHAVGHAITGGAFYRGSTFPSQYQGAYFFGDYLGNFIKWLDTSNGVHDWRSAESPVDIQIGPDGALYYASIGTGIIFRIQFQ